MTNSATAMTPPSKTREQFVADERAAERKVVEAEVAWMRADAAGDPAAAELRVALDAARSESLAIRQVMQEGLEAWTQYAAWQDAERRAAGDWTSPRPLRAEQ